MITQLLIAGITGLTIFLSVYGLKLVGIFIQNKKNNKKEAVIVGSIKHKVVQIISVFFGLLLLETIFFGIVGDILLTRYNSQILEFVFGSIMILTLILNIVLIVLMIKNSKK